MNFRKLILSSVAVAAMASTTLLQAQEEKKRGGQNGRGAMTPEAQIERIETAVGKLTDEQKTKITAIYAKVSEKMQAAREGGREKMMEIMTETRKEVRAVLTPEQQKKFDEMPQGRGQGAGGNRKKEN